MLRVRCLSVERFQQKIQADRVQDGGGSIHVWGAFHSGAKSPPVLTSELYRRFARQHFEDNSQYQDDNAASHHARVVIDFLQPGNVNKMKQPVRSLDCNPIEHIWNELDRAITSMDSPPQSLGELRQALLDKWAEIPVYNQYNSTIDNCSVSICIDLLFHLTVWCIQD